MSDKREFSKLLRELLADLPKTDNPVYKEHSKLVEYQQQQKPEQPALRPTLCPVCKMPVLHTPTEDTIVSDDEDFTVKSFAHGCGAVITYVAEYK